MINLLQYQKKRKRNEKTDHRKKNFLILFFWLVVPNFVFLYLVFPCFAEMLSKMFFSGFIEWSFKRKKNLDHIMIIISVHLTSSRPSTRQQSLFVVDDDYDGHDFFLFSPRSKTKLSTLIVFEEIIKINSAT